MMRPDEVEVMTSLISISILKLRGVNDWHGGHRERETYAFWRVVDRLELEDGTVDFSVEDG